MVSLIFYILVLILLSGFFSAAEIAFVSANKLGLEVLKNKGQVKGKLIADFYDHPREFLSSMLVGNNIVLVLLTILLSQLIDPLLLPYLGSGTISQLLSVTIIIAVVVLIFGEFIPKLFSQLYANEFLFKASYLIKFFMWFLFVPTWILTTISNYIIKHYFKNTIVDEGNSLSRVDLEDFINENDSQDIDKEILTNALNLGQYKVRDCMIPRNEIIYVDKEDNIDTVIEAFKLHKLSRILVINWDIENVVGYIHHQKLLKNPLSIDKIITPITFVPDAMGLKDLMHKFINERFNIACVVDEFGGISGLITLEDILEEIFGEIDDEHDTEDMIEIKVGEGEYVFAGRLEVDYLNQTYPELELPQGEYQTLSGLIVTNEENIPEQGTEIYIEDNIFILESVSDTKIERVRIKKVIKKINE
jgi:putative hemolysin